MKHLKILACLLISLSSSAELPALADKYTTCNDVSCSNYVVNKFNIHPSFFGGHYVYSDMVYASKEYKNEGLLFTPEGPVMMFNQMTGKLLVAGKDFSVHGDHVSFPSSTTVDLAPVGFSKPEKEDKDFNVRVTLEYPFHQMSVSYKKSESMRLLMSGSITDLRKIIKDKKDLKITYFGDSITFGANATGVYSAPNQPPFTDLTSAYLAMVRGGDVQWYNPSVPGWNSANAVSDETGRMLKFDSDVYVIAFGVNDSNDIEPKIFIANIEKLIKDIKAKNKHARIVLMSPTRPNPEWVLPKKEYFEGYRKGLSGLSKKYERTTFIDITDVWNQLLKRKNIWAITGNGVNHPGDFGHRVIAEALLTAFLGDDFS
jgi:lysophospholipase L1-like esterase